MPDEFRNAMAIARVGSEIPVLDLGPGGTVELARRERDRLADLLGMGRKHYSAIGISLGDIPARRWLARTDNPYLGEMLEIAALTGQPGVYALNMSYEWGCTTGVGPAADGMRLIRTLDWPLPGLGRHIVVARQPGAAGTWLNLTWPGYVGVISALAPGRFAAAINQPPMRRRTRSLVADWAMNRMAVWRSRHLPPAHLLRRVFEECRTYLEAKRILVETSLCMPAFFTLAGANSGEGCVIERQADRAFVHEAPNAAANHWIAPGQGDGERGADSEERRRRMLAMVRANQMPDRWLAPPILNSFTRLAMIACPATGELTAQG
jgi:hypothetical protein